MKRVWVIAFGLGVAIGWGIPQASRLGGVGEVEGGAQRLQGDKGGGHDVRVRVAGGQVWIAPERLWDLMGPGPTTALSLGSFLKSQAAAERPGLVRLAAWAGLDAAETKELERILVEATQARRRWEDEQVRVRKDGPGAWVVTIPGDGGEARDGLRQRLAGAFGEERAMAIELGGDLDGFFEFLLFAPGFRHGEVRVEAILRPQENGEDWGDRQVDLVISAEGRSLSWLTRMSRLESDAVIGGVGRFMGGGVEIERQLKMDAVKE